MSHRRSGVYRIGRPLAALVAVVGLLTGACGATGPADAALKTGARELPRHDLADFSLLDQQGKAFTRDSLRGGWSLLFFGYTSCPDVCPGTMTTLAAFAKGLRNAGDAVRPRVVFVSLDAQRDTPEQLARYVAAFDPEFIGVTAPDQATIAAVARQMGVFVMLTPRKGGGYNVDHSTLMLAVDPAGRIAATLTGPFTAAALADDFRRLVGDPP